MRERKYQIAAIHIMAILAMMTLLAGGRFGSVATKPIQAIMLTSSADRLTLSRLAQTYAELPLSFEANVGQADRRVKFLTKGSGYKLFLTGDEAVLAFTSLSPNNDGIADSRESKPTTHVHGPQNYEVPSRTRHQESSASAALRMKLVGAQPAATVSGLGELPGKSNYFIGSDPRKWRTSVSNFSKVKYKEVYPGVDLIYYGNQGQLEYDFVVAPGADPNQITLEFLTESLPLPSLRTSEGEDGRQTVRGGRQLKIDGNGDLVVATVGSEIRFHRPVSYQATSAGLRETGENGQRTPVQTHYVLVSDNRARFQVDAYDRSLPLIIDPVLSYSTYLGGSNNDYGNAIAVDGDGNVYVTGNTYSTDFPTVSPLKATKHGGWDAFVAKLNPSGTALVYSTYLGGGGTDHSEGIAVDTSGNAYVIGFTTSTNFPTAGDPLQPTNHGAGDAFVAKLNASGSALVYSTYLGGTAIDYGRSIAVDGTGDAYVTGYTASVNFPTANPLQPANHGGPSWCPCDGFVAKLNAKGSALIYSTYLGGSSDDGPHGIAVDSFGNAYVTGETYSTDFPTVNPIQPALHGNQDVFVFKLNASGSALVYSTYLGGKQADFGYDIAVNGSGNAYVTGFTGSADFPTANPLQPKKKGGQDAFVAELDATGSALVYSTYLGGTNNDEGVGIRVDGSGNAYVTGYTLSTDFPTANALQVTNHGGADAFVAELNADGSALTYSTYFGGSSNDYGRRIAVDSSGNVYWTGRTLSSDFPTGNPLQGTNHGLYDAFVVKNAPTSGP